jgi:hypothetical protein
MFVNDGDCDLDDDVFGVPIGCDITISTTTTGGKPFVPDALYDTSTNNNPLAALPEPNVALLLVAGLSSLAIFRRRLAL